MLYYYAVAAANDNNWLHGWFIEAFTTVMDAIDAGSVAPDWTTVSATYSEKLLNRPALRKDFVALVDAYNAASPDERAMTRVAMREQNDVLVACVTGVSVRADALASPIAVAAIDLGERLFKLLAELGVRKPHYAQLWKYLPVPICPFCGQNDLDPEDLPAEDLDHYLSRKIYPFAAANLQNLAPMCSRCNMDYKGAKDVLSGTGDVQRHYPYDVTEPGSVSLFGSGFFINGDEAPPEWLITLSPAAKAEEWDRIFALRKRYRRSILDNRWVDWLAEWVDVLPEHVEVTSEALAVHLKTWVEHWGRRGLREKAFLKAAYLALIDEVLTGGGVQADQLLGVIGGLLAMRRQPAA
jgi:hypothetical protein